MTTQVVLVVPAFNEAERFDPGAFSRAMEGDTGLGFVFVDDGSGDGTGELVRRFSAGWPGRVETIRLETNQGKGEAVRRGLRHALAGTGEFVGYWDADLATPLTELPGLLAPLLECPAVELVLASRVRMLGRHIERQPGRHYLGRIFATAASVLLRAPVYDTQCGAKLFRRSTALDSALLQPFLSRWIFDVELLARLDEHLPGGLARHAVEVPVGRWRDVRGTRLRSMDYARAATDLLQLAWARPQQGAIRHSGSQETT